MRVLGPPRPPPRRTRRDRPTGRSGRRRSLLDAGRGGRVGFIDFDGFCQAEPAMDLGVFRAAMVNIGMYARRTPAEPSARLAQVGALNDRFLGAYSELAGVSRRRVAVWEALELVTYVLNGWIKVQPPAAEPSGRTRGERNIDNPHNREMMNPTTT